MRRQKILAAIVCCAFGGLLINGPAVAQEAGQTPAAPPMKTIGKGKSDVVPSLIVINSAGAILENNKLTLTGVTPNSIVFADRPVRSAGHALTTHIIEDWASGGDSFEKDPPNATVSVFDKTNGTVQDVVVELMKPKLDGDKLTFDVNVLEGDISKANGPASVFIDIIGMPLTPFSFAGAARRGAFYAAPVVVAPYAYHPYAYPVHRCGYYPFPPCY